MLQFIVLPALIIVVCFIIISLSTACYLGFKYNHGYKQKVVTCVRDYLDNIEKYGNIYDILKCDSKTTIDKIKYNIKNYIEGNFNSIDYDTVDFAYDATNEIYPELEKKFNALNIFKQMNDEQHKIYSDIVNGNFQHKLENNTNIRCWEEFLAELNKIHYLFTK